MESNHPNELRGLVPRSLDGREWHLQDESNVPAKIRSLGTESIGGGK
jgi:hypothetical protein